MGKILIVDDDMINRKLVIAYLKKNGYTNTLEAENGLETLDKIKSEPIDLILLDIVMPKMDGIDVLKTLKKDANYAPYANIPVAILTTDDTKKNEALALGACNVLIKPIKEPELKTLLATYL